MFCGIGFCLHDTLPDDKLLLILFYMPNVLEVQLLIIWLIETFSSFDLQNLPMTLGAQMASTCLIYSLKKKN